MGRRGVRRVSTSPLSVPTADSPITVVRRRVSTHPCSLDQQQSTHRGTNGACSPKRMARAGADRFALTRSRTIRRAIRPTTVLGAPADARGLGHESRPMCANQRRENSDLGAFELPGRRPAGRGGASSSRRWLTLATRPTRDIAARGRWTYANNWRARTPLTFRL